MAELESPFSMPDGSTAAVREAGSLSFRTALVFAAATAILSAALTIPTYVLGQGESPPNGVDGRDYEHLALNLARGRGFAYCWSDAEWRDPYERAGVPGDSAFHLSLSGPCIPTARRAPGFPAAVGAAYWLFGRSFLAGRMLSAVALAAAGALGAFLAVRLGGVAAGALFAACFLADEQLRRLVGFFMSEPLACLVLLAVVAAHVAFLARPRVGMAALAGALLGLLVLVRYNFFPLWGVGLLAAAVGAIRSRPQRRVWVAYVGAALLLLAPWCVRNCVVLHALMPLGTQGGHVLLTRYAGQQAARADGSWDPEAAAKWWASREGRPAGYTYADLAHEMRSSLAAEREIALAGQEAARQWLRSSWRRLPGDTVIMLRAHARGYGVLGLAAVALTLVALALPEHRQVAALCLLVVTLTALTVALTFDVHGRFSAPVRPVAYLAGSLGLTGMLSRLVRREHHER